MHDRGRIERLRERRRERRLPGAARPVDRGDACAHVARRASLADLGRNPAGVAHALAPEYRRSPKCQNQRATANTTTVKPIAMTIVDHPSRCVTASAGTVMANPIGTRYVIE